MATSIFTEKSEAVVEMSRADELKQIVEAIGMATEDHFVDISHI